MTNASTQSEAATQQVLDHHLGAFAQGEIRAFFKAFVESADPGFWSAFKITSKSTAGEVAYLVWEAKPWVTLATDTLLIKNGKIAVQTFTPFSS